MGGCFTHSLLIMTFNSHPFLLFSFFLSVSLSSTAQQLDSVTLNAVVIQATRTAAESPVPHNNLTEKEIAQSYHAQDVPFLLSGIPSAVETSDAGAGVGYTGLRIRGSDPTRINITLNGVPLNDSESQGVFWVNLPDLAASASEIQVQRGVGSSTNGAGSFGATVNLDLSRISNQAFTTLTNTVGSFGLRKHSVQFGTGSLAGSNFSFTGRVSNIVSDGYIDRASADLKSLHLTGNYVDDRQSIQAHLLYGREVTYQAWYGLPAQLYDESVKNTFNPAGTERRDQPHPNEVDNYQQRHHLLHYKRTLRPNLLLQLNGHYTRGFGYFEQYKAQQSLQDYQMPDRLVGDSVISTSDLIRRRWLDNHFYGATWALVGQVGSSTLTFGGAANQYLGDHFGEVIWAEQATQPLGHRYYQNDAKKNDFNVFVKSETRLNDHWSGMLDLQYRHVQYTFEGFDADLRFSPQTAALHFFNPKAGLRYRQGPHISAWLFGGVAQREPNRDDFTQSSPTSRPKAEQLYNLETGYQTGGEQWSLSANFFGMYYINQLALDGRINDVGAYIRTNVPKSYRAGLELQGQIQPHSRWNIQANLALSQNRIVEWTAYQDDWSTGLQRAIVYRNTDLAFSPNLIARGAASFQIIDQTAHQLQITLIGKYVGAQFLDNTSNTNTQLPAFGFMDVRVNYDLKAWRGLPISLIASVNNVLDARFASNGWVYRFDSPGYDPRPDDPYTRRENGDTYHQAGYFPQAGRNYLLTLSIKF